MPHLISELNVCVWLVVECISQQSDCAMPIARFRYLMPLQLSLWSSALASYLCVVRMNETLCFHCSCDTICISLHHFRVVSVHSANHAIWENCTAVYITHRYPSFIAVYVSITQVYRCCQRPWHSCCNLCFWFKNSHQTTPALVLART